MISIIRTGTYDLHEPCAYDTFKTENELRNMNIGFRDIFYKSRGKLDIPIHLEDLTVQYNKYNCNPCIITIMGLNEKYFDNYTVPYIQAIKNVLNFEENSIDNKLFKADINTLWNIKKQNIWEYYNSTDKMKDLWDYYNSNPSDKLKNICKWMYNSNKITPIQYTIYNNRKKDWSVFLDQNGCFCWIYEFKCPDYIFEFTNPKFV